MRKVKSGVFLALFHFGLWCGSVHSIAEPIEQPRLPVQNFQISPQHVPHEGQYTNRQYGYSVTVPDGFKAYRDPAPAPQHGVAIPLDGTGYVWVDGSYNAPVFNSVEQFRTYTLDMIKKHGEGLEIVRSSLDKLAGMTTARILVQYRNRESGTTVMEEQLLAIRPDGQAIYTIGLISTEHKYKQHTAVLARLLKTWKLIPMSE